MLAYSLRGLAKLLSHASQPCVTTGGTALQAVVQRQQPPGMQPQAQLTCRQQRALSDTAGAITSVDCVVIGAGAMRM